MFVYYIYVYNKKILCATRCTYTQKKKSSENLLKYQLIVIARAYMYMCVCVFIEVTLEWQRLLNNLCLTCI